MNKFRPPAIPLITSDPYFSVWSFADNLYDDYTRHWTGKRNALAGLLKIDGVWHRFTQKLEYDASRYHREPRVIPQESVNVSPLTTRYIFANEKIRLTLDFMTPLLPDDLYLVSRPVSYIDYKVESADKKEHGLEIYFDISAEAAVDHDDQSVCFGKTGFSVFCGRGEADMLTKSGDDLRIDWGYLHLIAPGHEMFSLDIDGKRAYTEDRGYKFIEGERAVCDRYPALCCARSGKTGMGAWSGFICVGYDDINSVEYFGKQIKAYWRKDGESFETAAKRAVVEHGEITERVKSFESDFIKNASRISEKYRDIVSLAYRQAVAAHKLTYTPEDGEIQFCSKECYSNGCMATVDLTYPSMPLFLLYNPELICGMLNPVFKYAASDRWHYDFAPHDVGQYPLADGQRYGYDKKSDTFREHEHMRVEESGNVLLCVAALCEKIGDYSYAKKHFAPLEKWANYLAGAGWDPENQLCTDDFAGHLAHNCNLSIKGILGIAAWGKLLCKMGDAEKGEIYRKKALDMAANWKSAAFDGECYRLAFDRAGTWSIKYNLVWDRLLDLGIFDEEIAKTEIEFYKTKINAYGLPLDIRSDYTKSDWQMWSAALTDDSEYAEKIVGAMWDMLNCTDDRVPFTDWYFTSDAKQRGFQNRSVQGGLFIQLIDNK
jgi:hypothetical protein